MIPTVAEVVAEIQDILGDQPGRVFDSALATRGYQRAYRRLREEMLQCQIPAIIRVTIYSLPSGTTVLTPATSGIPNFGELIEISERDALSSDNYVPLTETEEVVNGTPGESLRVFEWREDSFLFYGATNTRELRIRYYDSGDPPTDGPVGIDGSLPFLSHYGAAIIGPTRGYDSNEITRLRQDSELYLHNALQPMVRGMQRLQRQPRPYGAGPYGRRRAMPPVYIAAPPTDPSNVTHVLTITGVQDGVNNTFLLSKDPQSLQLFRNGVLLYPDVAYTRVSTLITFSFDYIPRPTDLLRAEAII